MSSLVCLFHIRYISNVLGSLIPNHSHNHGSGLFLFYFLFFFLVPALLREYLDGIRTHRFRVSSVIRPALYLQATSAGLRSSYSPKLVQM